MVNSPGARKFSNSWNDFAAKGGAFATSLLDGKNGTSLDAFKNLYTGASAPWAWGLTGATAATMAGAFGRSRSAEGGNYGLLSGVGTVLPWLALGGIAYGGYKLYKNPNWMRALSAASTLSNGSLEDKWGTLNQLNENPEVLKNTRKLVGWFGRKDDLNKLDTGLRVNRTVGSALNAVDTGRQWLRNGGMAKIQGFVGNMTNPIAVALTKAVAPASGGAVGAPKSGTPTASGLRTFWNRVTGASDNNRNAQPAQ
jgi:hypothetical protein